MNAVLDFPSLPTDAAPPLAPRTEVATAAAGALDLESINLTDLALAKFGDWRGKVAAATANLGTLALDLSTQARVNDAKSLRERLINVPRADARKVSKALRSKFAATGKDVATAEEQIVAAWDECETLITPKIEAAQQTLDAEKARRAAEEEARKDKHRSGIENIRCYLTRCQAPGMTSLRVANGIKILAEQTFDPAEWEEFAVPAANAQCETLEAMRQLQAQLLGREQEAERQERIRAENARVAAELAAERARIEAEAAEVRRQAQELQNLKDEAAAAELLRQARELNAQKEREAVPTIVSFIPGAAPVFSDSAEFGVVAVDAIARDTYLPPTAAAIAPPPAESAPAVPSCAEGMAAPADVCAAEPDLMALSAEFVAYAATAFEGKFKAQPKVGAEWWAGLRSRIDALQPLLAARDA